MDEILSIGWMMKASGGDGSGDWREPLGRMDDEEAGSGRMWMRALGADGENFIRSTFVSISMEINPSLYRKFFILKRIHFIKFEFCVVSYFTFLCLRFLRTSSQNNFMLVFLSLHPLAYISCMFNKEMYYDVFGTTLF